MDELIAASAAAVQPRREIKATIWLGLASWLLSAGRRDLMDELRDIRFPVEPALADLLEEALATFANAHLDVDALDAATSIAERALQPKWPSVQASHVGYLRSRLYLA
jgi:hypothetical protein